MSKKNKPYQTLQPEEIQLYIDSIWQYYRSLEDDYTNVGSDNLQKKISLTKLLIVVCSEVEVMLKTICQTYEPTYFGENIGELREKIDEMVINGEWDAIDRDVVLKDSNKHYRPWKGYDGPNYTIDWWTKYNKLKHHRSSLAQSGATFFDSVSIEDVINALAALYILEIEYMEYMSGYADDCPADIRLRCKSRLFETNL